jgi:Leucine-rich repeat (LRR) protein
MKTLMWITVFLVCLVTQTEASTINQTTEQTKKSPGEQAIDEFLSALKRDNPNVSFDDTKLLNIKNSHLNKPSTLSIEDLGLNVIPPEIKNLMGLKLLNATGNKLKTFPPQMGQLTNLESIVAYENPLEVLPPEFENLKNLTALMLHGDFTSFPPVIVKLLKLDNLAIGKSRIEYIPDDIHNLKNLIDLDLEGNQIRNLPEGMCGLINITQLNLSHNGITHVPTCFFNLKKLVSLELKGNPIAEDGEPGRTLGKQDLIKIFGNAITF